MIRGEKAYLEKLCKWNLCAEHKRPLSVVWVEAEKCYAIACADEHLAESLVRDLDLAEKYRRGELTPEKPEEPQPDGAPGQAITPRCLPSPEFAALLPRTDLATGQPLAENQTTLICAYARSYGLDPYRGHIALMYGKPYITIDGYYYHAKRTGETFWLDSRPLTDEERKSHMIPDGAHAWKCELTFHANETRVTGLGVVTAEEMTERSEKHPERLRAPVVSKYPWLMAQKRAEWQALRRAFPLEAAE